MYRLFLMLWLGCVTTTVYAEQRVPVQEGSEVTITVSSNALNRIAIENDQIITVKGITGQFELDKDAELGQIFLKPIATDKQELIHLFLITKQGHTYPLSLVVQEGDATSILLMPIEQSQTTHWEQSNNYETLLRTLVQAMVNHTPIEGFSFTNHKLPLPTITHTKVTQLKSCQGHQLQGQILEVTNTGKEELTLTDQAFYQKGVRAVAIVNPILSSKQKTLVYMVR